MQMTHALQQLVNAQDRDAEFPYLDFLDAFLKIEHWIARTDTQALDLLQRADPADLLGESFSCEEDDLKLSYVMELLRDHGLELSRRRVVPLLH